MRMLGHALVTALLYFAAARYSVLLHDLAGLGAVFWPGAGVTVTALLVSPRRFWPAILVAVGLAELGNDLLLGFGAVASLWWAAANMVEPLVAAWLIQRWRAEGFGGVGAVVRFVGAVAAAPILGGAIGAIGTQVAALSELPYAVTVGQWLVGDGLGMLTVVPFGLLLLGRLPTDRLWSVEGALALLAVGIVSVTVFNIGAATGAVASGYLVLIPMVWAAVRLHVAGAAVALFLMAQVGNTLNALGRGPFAGSDLTLIQGSLQLQFFLATAGITVLLLACRTAESETFQDLADMRARLIASVSHELRTPLTPILGFAELLLRRDQLDPQTRQGLEVIHRNGRHLTSLVEDLLWASRASRGALPVHPESVRIATVVDERLLGRDGDPVEVTIEPPEARAWVDRTHLIQILTNLLDNAARHGRPPVAVRVSSDGEHTQIVVADQGDAVPDWFEPNLFDEFAQARSGDQRPTLGLGLGLPIARTLAIANDGDLTYQRQKGETQFVVRLPAIEAPTDPADQASGERDISGT